MSGALPAARRFNFYVVILKHTLLDVFGVHVVGGIGAAVISAVIDLNGDVSGLGESSVNEFGAASSLNLGSVAFEGALINCAYFGNAYRLVVSCFSAGCHGKDHRAGKK